MVHITPSDKRVLFVTYTFPPVGGAGVQRVAKFVKYLDRFGWLPSVLTTANPSVPVPDTSLLDDIPAATVIRRARTLEPSYAIKQLVSGGGRSKSPWQRMLGLLREAARRVVNLVLQPDPQILWAPGAIRSGLRLLKELPHQAIVATGPPFSAFLIGAALSRKTGVPLVLDYRDEWDLSNAYLENKGLGLLSRSIQGYFQRRVVHTARAIIATSCSSSRTLDTIRTEANSKAQVTWIYNGYDPSDFPEPPPRPAQGEFFRLAYIGTLWNLTSVEPLVRAVEALSAQAPSLAAALELIFVGRRTASQDSLLVRLENLPCRVTLHPYLPHEQALHALRTADALCVLLSDLPGADRVVPAKLFECMAAHRPILAITPPGEVWDILRPYPGASLFAPTDVAGTADWLARTVRQQLHSGVPAVTDWEGPVYDRPSQAGQLAALLDSLS